MPIWTPPPSGRFVGIVDSVAAPPPMGRQGHHALFGVQRFHAYLMARGLCPRPIVSNARPLIPAVITEFTGWYQTHRGVDPPTLRHYARGAMAMLDALGADVRTWTPHAVRQFLMAAVPGGRSESMQKLITATRAFLRYLAFRGDARADLGLAVPRGGSDRRTR